MNDYEIAGKSVFPVGLGSNTFGWTADRDAAFAILDAFTDAGGTLVDCADSYAAWVEGNVGGESEQLIGEWLESRGARDDVIVTTKGGRHPELQGLSAGNIAAAIDESLRRLRVDNIDLYYAHAPDPDVPVEETVGAFASIVQAGKASAVGLSNHDASQVDAWIEAAGASPEAVPVALQPHYNLVHRRDYEPELRSRAVDLGLAVFPYFSLASGFLTGKYRTAADLDGVERGRFVARYFSDQGLEVVDALADVAEAHDAAIATVALAWLRAQPGVAAPLASVSRVDQLADLMAAAELDLDGDEVGRLDAVSLAVDA